MYDNLGPVPLILYNLYPHGFTAQDNPSLTGIKHQCPPINSYFKPISGSTLGKQRQKIQFRAQEPICKLGEMNSRRRMFVHFFNILRCTIDSRLPFTTDEAPKVGRIRKQHLSKDVQSASLSSINLYKCNNRCYSVSNKISSCRIYHFYPAVLQIATSYRVHVKKRSGPSSAVIEKTDMNRRVTMCRKP